MRPVASSLSASLFTVSQSAPDLSLIFLESLEYFIELYLFNCILELLLSILSKRFRCSNESNQKVIRDRSSKVETAASPISSADLAVAKSKKSEGDSTLSDWPDTADRLSSSIPLVRREQTTWEPEA